MRPAFALMGNYLPGTRPLWGTSLIEQTDHLRHAAFLAALKTDPDSGVFFERTGFRVCLVRT